MQSYHSPDKPVDTMDDTSYRIGDPYAVRVKRKEAPPVSIYVAETQTPSFTKISCMFCKRTIIETNVEPVQVITAPLPFEQFTSAGEIQCSLCSQKWRILMV
jgi:hypothetical protein